MEINLGTKVKNLVDKNIVEKDNININIPKGQIGYFCDLEYITSEYVMIQFYEEEIINNGTGVYLYNIKEMEITK